MMWFEIVAAIDGQNGRDGPVGQNADEMMGGGDLIAPHRVMPLG